MAQLEYSLKNKGFKQLIAVSLGHFTNDFYVGIIAPISVYFAYKLGLNLTQQGLISVAVLVFSSLLQPLFGLLSDKKGKPKHLIISIIWIATLISLSGVINNFYILLLVIALGSSASALYHPLGSTTAVTLGRRSKGTSLSIFMTIGGFAGTVASVVGLWIASSFGIEKIVFLVVPGMLVAGFMYCSGVQNIKIDTFENRKKDNIGNKIEEVKKLKLTKKSMFWLGVLLYISIMKVLSGRFIITYAIQILSLKNFAYGVVLLSIHLLGRPIGTMVGGILIDKIGDKKVFIFGMFLSLLSLSLIGYGSSWIAAVGVGILGFCSCLTNTVGVLVSHKIIPDSQSFATGIIMGIPGGVGSLTMIIFSGIADANGLIYSVKALILPFAVATVLTFFMLYRRNQ
ncbi:MAG: MFS transporter [Eubacteriales bacterium]